MKDIWKKFDDGVDLKVNIACQFHIKVGSLQKSEQ